MKTGKKLFGPIIMTVMIVLAISSILVAAAVTSNMLTWTSTSVSAGSITLDTANTVATTPTGTATAYTFHADVPKAITGAVMTITITGASGMTIANITSVSVSGIGTPGTVTLTAPTGNVMTVTCALGSVAAATDLDGVVTITYAYAGAYVVAVSMTGN